MNSRLRNLILIIVVVLVAAIVGGYVARSFQPANHPPTEASSGRRSIIQIVRQQPGFPSLADQIAKLCPSVAVIVPAGSSGPGADGFALSADGWVVASTAALPRVRMEAHFNGGPAAPVGEVRSDPVSGLSIVKADVSGLTPVPFGDQAFPRVGDFGFAIRNPKGTGCSAQAAMVASDFLADGGSALAYIRLQAMGPDLAPGAPFLSPAGQALGLIAPTGPVNSVIPADIVSDIADELLRGTLSPTTNFGFRAEDFSSALASRLSDARSSGTAVALVQPKSPAARAGLAAGDIVLTVDGSPVASASELGRALDKAGKSVSIEIARGDQRQTLTIGRMPQS